MAAATVTSGGNEFSSETLVGKTVDQVRSSLTSVLNISREAVPHVNGECVNGSYTLKADDDLEFIKPAGQKGLSI